MLFFIGLFLIAAITVIIMFILYLRRRIKKAMRKVLQTAWNRVIAEKHPTLKVVEADKLLDEALRHLGFTGTLGEKLKQAGARFTNEDAVWRAHKLRNSLVHDLRKIPTDKEVDDAMRSYRQALRDLGV